MGIMLFAVILVGILAMLAFASTWAEPRNKPEPTPEEAGILAQALAALISKINAERM